MIYLLLKAFLLPPGLFILLGATSIMLHRHRPTLSWGLLCCSTALLWAMSTLLLGQYAMRLIEPTRPLSQQQVENFEPQAIIVLGADRSYSSPEYGGKDQPGRHLLTRLRYAAKVYRQTSLPILVSGGIGYFGRAAQAQVMADVLRQDYRIPVQWLEEQSMTTWENATNSHAILERSGIDRVLLVTEAFHMPRAIASFRALGLCVLPAPTFFLGRSEGTVTWQDLVPSAAGLELSVLALHEALGLLYYQLRFFNTSDPAGTSACPAQSSSS